VNECVCVCVCVSVVCEPVCVCMCVCVCVSPAHPKTPMRSLLIGAIIYI